MANLATTFCIGGQREKAEKLNVQVLKTRKRVLGQEHPSTLTSMANLAWTLKSQNRRNEAWELLTECVRLHRKILGMEHPYTKLSLSALKELGEQSYS